QPGGPPPVAAGGARAEGSLPPGRGRLRGRPGRAAQGHDGAAQMRRALAAAALLALLGAACKKKPAEDVETTAPVPVQVAEARLGTITSYVRVTGTVDPAPGGDWVVTAPQQARVAEIRFATGDVV